MNVHLNLDYSKPAEQLALEAQHPRSPDWEKVRDEFVKNNPTCAFCGGGTNLNVHHKKPFHLFPQLELDPSNLMTLCRTSEILDGADCHYIIGHFGNWKSFNPNVDADAERYLNELLSRPKG